VCIDCHMPLVERPVAVGQSPRLVYSHVFPASSKESQLRKAYAYDAQIEGNEVVVRLTNKGVGHNFPTANRQRGVESLVIVRDPDGKEVARSRMVCRYPYASELQPHQLTPPQSSQIPSGKTSVHRVPLTVADGTVECRLYFKRYRPSADTDAQLARCLEERRLPFSDVEPSTQAVEPVVEIDYPAAPTELGDFLSPMGLANVARGPDTGEPVVVPKGETPEEIGRLAGMLESHLPEVRKQAYANLAAVYPASADALVAALGRWSNESFNGARRVFLAIGEPAVPALVGALDSDQLYVRCHARGLLARIGCGDQRATALQRLRQALDAESPLDRRSAAQALGELGDTDAIPLLRARLDDGDWDVVHAAAQGLAALGDVGSVPAMMAVLDRAPWPETRRALALALATLGSSGGVQPLIDDLRDDDELQREYAFDALFSITGRHFGYEPAGPAPERLYAQGRMQAWWTAEGDRVRVHAPQRVDAQTREITWSLVEHLGGGTDTVRGGDDAQIERELDSWGGDALPALIEGLTFPPGFAEKRALCCQLLGRIGSQEAAPYLAAALRDPVPAVADWACWALETCGDVDTPAQIRSYENRIPELVGFDRGAGPDAPADAFLARAARTRMLLGDVPARVELVDMLSSRNTKAREIAIGALRQCYGEDRGYDPEADPDQRAEAALRWRAP